MHVMFIEGKAEAGRIGFEERISVDDDTNFILSNGGGNVLNRIAPFAAALSTR